MGLRFSLFYFGALLCNEGSECIYGKEMAYRNLDFVFGYPYSICQGERKNWYLNRLTDRHLLLPY
jgi:hypothetical protein